MIKVLVQFDLDADIIECPNWIIKDLELHQQSFNEWLFDEMNDHSYWVYENGEKYGCCYRSNAFVEWLNRFILKECDDKAFVIDKQVDMKEIETMPTINF